MSNNWIIGLGSGEHKYKIGDVTYIVASHFIDPFKQERTTITDKLKSFIGSDFADLTPDMDADIIGSEYVWSAVGKEDLCSRKIKN